MKLIGIDSGLAAFGVAVADVSDAGLRFGHVEVWTTRPTAKKRRIRKADETAERIRTLAGCLHQLVVQMKPIALCVEAVALPFGRSRPSVVSALGRARGIVDTLAEVHRLPVLEWTPQEVKRVITGTEDASKDAVRVGLEAKYVELAAQWPVQKTLVEHAADAAAVIHASRNADVVLAALRARSAA